MMRREILYEGFLTVERGEHGYEVVRVTDAVVILIYVRDLDRVVFVRQRRPAMMSEGNPQGWTLELPAGRIDKPELSPRAIAVIEAEEEAGIVLYGDDVIFINGGRPPKGSWRIPRGRPLATSPGVLTERIYLCYAEATAAQMRESVDDALFGCAEEGEKTIRHLAPAEDLKTMIFDSVPTKALVEWFLRERRRKKGEEA